MWIIITGDFYKGVVDVIGPFMTEEDAEEYAETNNLGHYPKHIFSVSEPNK